MKEMLIDISNEMDEKLSSLKLKNIQEIKQMRKTELEFELKRVLPKYYEKRLIIFKDSH
jgi:hypothetical protein